MKLQCKVCAKEWNYKGKNKVYASCPDCRRAVRIVNKLNQPKSRRKLK